MIINPTVKLKRDYRSYMNLEDKIGMMPSIRIEKVSSHYHYLNSNFLNLNIFLLTLQAF